jgi:aminoglycoside phosphotransferase (APT) family kinase protein
MTARGHLRRSKSSPAARSDASGRAGPSWEGRRIIRRIVGARAKIHEIQEPEHIGAARILLFDAGEPPRRFVLKSYRKRKHAVREARNLRAANRVAGIRAPRFAGRSGANFVYEYVPGRPLEHIAHRSTSAERELLVLTAIGNLTAIHGAAHAIGRKWALRDPFRRPRLERKLRRVRDRIVDVGLPAYSELCGDACEPWEKLLTDSLLEKLVNDLRRTPDTSVLGHCDYHGSNLIVTPEEDVYAIDWQYLSWATPWYDLAYPLQLLEPEERSEMLLRYLEEMRWRRQLTSVSDARAQVLSRSGIAYLNMIMAMHNSRDRSHPRALWHAEQLGKLLRQLVAAVA